MTHNIKDVNFIYHGPVISCLWLTVVQAGMWIGFQIAAVWKCCGNVEGGGKQWEHWEDVCVAPFKL